MTKKFEFHYAFQLTRKIIFEVNFYTLSDNKTPHFSTTVEEFNQPKTDYCRCGQAQKDLCSGLAKMFYKKWDKYHLKDITEQEVFDDLIKDIEYLKQHYNYLEIKGEKCPDSFRFWQLKNFSMQKVKGWK